MKKHLMIIPLFLFIFSLGGCSSNPSDSPEGVANVFWQAVIDKDMEKAKGLATWDTVSYLKYLNSNKTHPERFELGETMIGEKGAEIGVTPH
jgi:hypothetical protein